jgi:hypothetical protein
MKKITAEPPVRLVSTAPVHVEPRGAGVLIQVPENTILSLDEVTELCARLLGAHNEVIRRGVQ